MSGLEAGDDWTALLAGFLIAGGGIGLANPALATAAVGVVEPQRAGMASGINSTFRQVGIATGIAGLGRDLPAPRGRELRGRRGPAAARRAPGAVADFVSFGGARRVGDRRSRARPRRRSSTASTTSCCTPGCSRSWARLATVLTRPRDFVAHAAPAAAG